MARLGAIGDCLRVLPSVHRLRVAFPEASIGWVVGDLVRPLLEGHPDIDRLHVLSGRAMRAGVGSAVRELHRAGAELAATRYDVAIDFHTRLKSGFLVRASGAPLRIGFDRASGSEANFLFTNCHVRLDDPWENRALRFARLLGPLLGSPGQGAATMDAVEAGRALWIEPAADARAAAMHEAAGGPAVALFAGTSAHREGDRWPLDKWKALVAALSADGVESMVLWGPGEIEAATALAEAGGGRCRLAPPTTLPEMMALLGRFRLYVGTNTAALHMAWMQGVPCVVLAGGRPWRTDRPLAPVPSEMLSAGAVEPPRKLHGAAARRAIEGIEVRDVLAAARRLLGE